MIEAQDALRPDAPRVHDGLAGNVVVESRFATADFDAAMEGANRRIGVTLRSRRQNATPIEARGAHAAFDPATGRITLTCATQMPHLLRTAIADVLGMPKSDLRVVAPDVGGGFGQKMSLPAEYAVLVWLARKLSGSVGWSEDRRENLIAAFHSRDQNIRLDGAFDAHGKLIALSADVLANIGAYSCFPTTCGVEPLMAAAELPGPYDVRAYACVARGVTTHTCTMAPYRGVSRPVITTAIERLMDKAAAAFGVSPVEIRKRNLIGHFPYTSATGLVFDEGSYLQTLEQAAGIADLPASARSRAKRAAAASIAALALQPSPNAPATAARLSRRAAWRSRRAGNASRSRWIRPAASKPASARARTARGCARRLAQIIADEVGVTPQEVRVVHGDTDRTPYGWGTFASRSLVIAGGASLLAARKIRHKLLIAASHVLEAAADDIVLETRQRQSVRHRPRRADRGAGARRLSSDPQLSRVRSAPDCAKLPTTIRPAPFPTPVTSRSSNSTPKPGA